jgi:hypothetical protein
MSTTRTRVGVLEIRAVGGDAGVQDEPRGCPRVSQDRRLPRWLARVLGLDPALPSLPVVLIARLGG